MLTTLQFQDRLTLLFCLVDDLLAHVPRSPQQLGPGNHSGGRLPALSASEALTLALFRFWTGERTWKGFHQWVRVGFRSEFPRLPSYETLVRQVRQHGPLALCFLVALLGARQADGTYALDATALPVSRQGRRAKVLRGLAAWGRDSQGHWFYGLKLHAVCDPQGRLRGLRLTPGNAADVTQAEDLLAHLHGLAVADAAYISRALREKLWELGLLLLTPLRKNMKGVASPEQLQALQGRSIIETVFGTLKERLGLATSLPRSLDGYLAHYVHTLLAYQLGRLAVQALTAPALP
jgi:hypothetical protein